MTAKPVSLDALTGLRFVAAMLVVLVHGFKFAQGYTSIGPLASNAVTFFFVLSGFILTYVYHERLANTGVLKFYWARFARIWPLHIFCLAAMLWVQGYIFGDRVLPLDGKLAAHLCLLQSWFPIDNLPMQFNGPAWSISTEFGFYLLFPILLLLITKRPLVLLVSSIVFLVASLNVFDVARSNGLIELIPARSIVYVNPLVRVFDFIAGMFVATLFLNWHVKAKGDPKTGFGVTFAHTICEVFAFGLTAATIYVANYTSFPEFMKERDLLVSYAWLSRGGAGLIGFCLIIWVFSWSRGLLAKLLSTPLLVYLGEVSFALYLIQLPVFYFLNQRLYDQNWPATLYLIVSISAATAAAMLAHALIENPFRQFFTSMYDRDWRAVRTSMTLGFKSLRKHHTGLIACLFLMLCYGVVNFEKRYGSVKVPAQKLLGVANDLTDVQFETVTFEREAVLHWLNVDDQGSEVHLTMWWELLPGHQRARFMHLVDEEGNILKVCHGNKKDFIGQRPGSFVLEKLALKKTEFISGMKYVGIGFWLEGLGSAPADRGQRQMSQRRLLVAEITDQGVVGIHEPEILAENNQKHDGAVARANEP
jgi:peptidoglycan/LPS O-acetylase OafA/YrhL